jgi:hypothetical protein
MAPPQDIEPDVFASAADRARPLPPPRADQDSGAWWPRLVWGTPARPSAWMSRRWRNNRDWYQLLDLCGLTNTLIIDSEGVYDPRQLHDRLLLGLKGTMSEAELGWIRQRAHEALLAKARRGKLILGLPVGYVTTGTAASRSTPTNGCTRRSSRSSTSSPSLAACARYCDGFARSASRCRASPASRAGASE